MSEGTHGAGSKDHLPQNEIAVDEMDKHPEKSESILRPDICGEGGLDVVGLELDHLLADEQKAFGVHLAQYLRHGEQQNP